MASSVQTQLGLMTHQAPWQAKISEPWLANPLNVSGLLPKRPQESRQRRRTSPPRPVCSRLDTCSRPLLPAGGRPLLPMRCYRGRSLLLPGLVAGHGFRDQAEELDRVLGAHHLLGLCSGSQGRIGGQGRLPNPNTSPTRAHWGPPASGISTPNSSSNAMTTSTVSSESRPRSFWKWAVRVTLEGSTWGSLERAGHNVKRRAARIPRDALESRSREVGLPCASKACEGSGKGAFPVDGWDRAGLKTRQLDGCLHQSAFACARRGSPWGASTRRK